MDRWCGVVALVLVLASPGQGGTIATVAGRVVAADGKPVVGAAVAAGWFANQAAPVEPDRPARTDADGRFALEVESNGRDLMIMARDATGTLGGMAVVPGRGADGPVRIEVAPLAEVRARFTSEHPGWSMGQGYATLSALPGKLRVVAGRSQAATFALRVPPGRYHLAASGDYRHDEVGRELALAPGEVLDLGAIALPLTPIARLFGREPPPWHVTAARGVPAGVQLADFRGKWVVLEFWGYWCDPCVGRSLPGWLDFAEDHAADRDRFVILAIHDPQATDFAMLDAKLAPIIRRRWRGRPLPFPILLDTTGDTVRDFGVRSWPTVVIIDPAGKVADVPQGIRLGLHAEDFLAAQLTPLPAAVRLARALDRDLPLGTADDGTLGELLRFYAAVGRVKIHLDPAEARAARVDESTPIPLYVAGRLTLRAWLNLTLDPFGLTYVADGDGLRIVRRTPTNADLARPSPRQDWEGATVAEAMRGRGSFAFHAEPLNRVVAALGEEIGESILLDPIARQAGTLRPEATATGAATDEAFGPALTRLLAPLGLKWVVRDEAVVVTPGP